MTIVILALWLPVKKTMGIDSEMLFSSFPLCWVISFIFDALEILKFSPMVYSQLFDPYIQNGLEPNSTHAFWILFVFLDISSIDKMAYNVIGHYFDVSMMITLPLPLFFFFFKDLDRFNVFWTLLWLSIDCPFWISDVNIFTALSIWNLAEDRHNSWDPVHFIYSVVSYHLCIIMHVWDNTLLAFCLSQVFLTIQSQKWAFEFIMKVQFIGSLLLAIWWLYSMELLM